MQEQRHQPDYILLFTVVILCAVGVVTVYSASTYFALDSGLAPNHYALRQLVAACLGLALMGGVTQVSYSIWYRYAPKLMALVLVLLTLVLIPGIGIAKMGGRRWLGHGTLSFQPSEFALIVLAMYLAFFFSKQVAFSDEFRRGLLPALVVSGLTFGLVFLEPDMGTALTLLGVALIVAIASGTRLKPLLILIAGSFPILLGLALASRYRSSRITAFLHPFPQTANSYQLLQGWTAFTNGGLFGRGFGMSIEKTGYLPVPHIDFIFPVFVEEWGVVGAIALLSVFGVLIWRGFWIARHAKDRFGAVLAVGLTSIITVGTFINLGAVTGLLPVTGIPLPFISYGGTSLVMSLIAMGMLLAVSRYTLEEAPESDELAAVIEVSEARRRIAPSRPDTAIVTGPTRTRPASVERLRPKRTASSRVPTHGTWRAADEVAATRERQTAGRQTSTGTSGRQTSGRSGRSSPTRSTATARSQRAAGRVDGPKRSSVSRSSVSRSANNRAANARPANARATSSRVSARKTDTPQAATRQKDSRSRSPQAGMTWRERNQLDRDVRRGKPAAKKSPFRRER